MVAAPPTHGCYGGVVPDFQAWSRSMTCFMTGLLPPSQIGGALWRSIPSGKCC